MIELSCASSKNPTWRECYDPVLVQLRAKNNIDLTTLPNEEETESLLTQLRRMMSAEFRDLNYEAKKRIEDELLLTGPLEALLNDPTITEICVNGHDNIWFEKNGQISEHNDHFHSPISYQNFILRMTAECRIQANLDRPYADGFWRQFRVHLIIPPLAQGEAHLSLRRHPNKPWTLARLKDEGWASPEALEQIREIIQSQKSFLILGATGTGKTSLLNACLQEVSERERIVTIEDTSELHLPNRVSAKLVSRTDPNGVLHDVDQMELLRQALRMRPDRIIMGEIRGAEAKDLLMTLSTGHKGGMGTLHADHPRQALIRLEMLIQLGAPQWSIQAIRNLIFFGVQYMICVGRVDGHRRLESIHRIATLEDHGFCLEPVWETDKSSK